MKCVLFFHSNTVISKLHNFYMFFYDMCSHFKIKLYEIVIVFRLNAKKGAKQRRDMDLRRMKTVETRYKNEDCVVYCFIMIVQWEKREENRTSSKKSGDERERAENDDEGIMTMTKMAVTANALVNPAPILVVKLRASGCWETCRRRCRW